MKQPFLKEETIGLRTQQTFVGKKCEIYLPDYYFDKNDPNPIAQEQGDKIETIGLFWFNVDGKWFENQLPLKMQFQFSEKRKDKLKIKPELPEMSYIIFQLNNGDAFMYNILHKKNVDDLKLFINKLIENAKLPATVPYNDIFNIFINAMDASSYRSLGISSVSIEFLLSELCRNKKNMHQAFRFIADEKSEFNYKMTRIVKVPELNSTFTGIMGEDNTNQVVSSILKTREGVIEKESPIEKIIKH